MLVIFCGPISLHQGSGFSTFSFGLIFLNSTLSSFSLDFGLLVDSDSLCCVLVFELVLAVEVAVGGDLA